VEDSRVFSAFFVPEKSNELQILGFQGKINSGSLCYLVWEFLLDPMARPY
jgi:hypothetical protein